MKRIKKLSALLIAAILLIAAFAPAALAAEAKAGQTVSLNFTIPNTYGADGSFSLSNPGMFSGVSYSASTALSGGVNGSGVIYFYSNGGPGDVTVTVTATIVASAQPGDSCTVSLAYECCDEQGNMLPWEGLSQTVTVIADSAPTPTLPPEQPTPPVGPVEPAEDVDYSELKKQIAIAEGYSSEGYTAESWKTLEDALATAKDALLSTDQAVVDRAAAELAAAIGALEKVDYSELEKAIADAEGLLSDSELGQTVLDLMNAILNGKELLNSDDQAAVDAAVESIRELIAKLQEMLDALNAETEPVVSPEPIVPPEPVVGEEDCTIPMHQVWPILFFISLALNVVFIVILVVVVARRKKNQKDDTPLVNYDIGDDN